MHVQFIFQFINYPRNIAIAPTFKLYKNMLKFMFEYQGEFNNRSVAWKRERISKMEEQT